jgi:Dpy-30 motif
MQAYHSQARHLTFWPWQLLPSSQVSHGCADDAAAKEYLEATVAPVLRSALKLLARTHPRPADPCGFLAAQIAKHSTASMQCGQTD